MARRGHELQAKPLDVVDRIVDGVDLELAAVARAGIDLADGKGAAELLAGPFAQRTGDFLERVGARTGRRNGGLALRKASSRNDLIVVS